MPDSVELEVDIRTSPGERGADVARHLKIALGDLADEVELAALMNDPASIYRHRSLGQLGQCRLKALQS